MLATPKKYTLVAGSGEGQSALTAFDKALLDSGLGNLNLLKVSSILPPQSVYEEHLSIPPGSLVPTAFAAISSKTPGEIISAAVAVGVPAEDTFGVIMECSGICSEEEIRALIARMVTEAFAARNMALKEIKVRAVQHEVVQYGCAFAGVALWY